MYKKILLLVAVPFLLCATNLSFTQGEIKAHTEIFGDSNINPSTKVVMMEASIDDSIESLRGKFTIKATDLKSSNSDRDEHMHETIDAANYPLIVVNIQNVTKSADMYQLDGTVMLHGVTRALSTMATINKNTTGLSISGSFAVNLTDHQIKPPKLLFLTVRDRIDITYNLELK